MPERDGTGDGEILRIAQDLAAKYGTEAIGFVKDRAARAEAVGDQLAHDIWKQVLAVMNAFAAHQL